MANLQWAAPRRASGRKTLLLCEQKNWLEGRENNRLDTHASRAACCAPADTTQVCRRNQLCCWEAWGLCAYGYLLLFSVQFTDSFKIHSQFLLLKASVLQHAQCTIYRASTVCHGHTGCSSMSHLTRAALRSPSPLPLFGWESGGSASSPPNIHTTWI